MHAALFAKARRRAGCDEGTLSLQAVAGRDGASVLANKLKWAQNQSPASALPGMSSDLSPSLAPCIGAQTHIHTQRMFLLHVKIVAATEIPDQKNS